MTKSEALVIVDKMIASLDPQYEWDARRQAALRIARAALANQIAGEVVSEAADVQVAERHARGECDRATCPVCALHPKSTEPCRVCDGRGRLMVPCPENMAGCLTLHTRRYPTCQDAK